MWYPTTQHKQSFQWKWTSGSFSQIYCCKMRFLTFQATLVLPSVLTPSVSHEANPHSRPKATDMQPRQRLQAITRNAVSNLLRNNLPALVPCSDRNLGQVKHCPAVSCSDIVAQSQVLRSSGYYWIISSNRTAMQVYCDMDAALCNQGRGTTQTNPADSCSDLIYTCLNGFYWIRSPNGTAVQVYCDVERLCSCNSTGWWTRVAYLNMTDPSWQCPSAGL